MILTAGVDEAGRGALVGDVVAAAVILPANYDLPKLNDSKRLNERQREILALAIKEQALAYSIARVSPQEIDALNIHHATLLAMKKAVEALPIEPEFVQIDGKYIPKLSIPAEAIIGGDALIASISAASILAKTARDADLRNLDKKYPQYGFAKHKGYPTPAHKSALLQFGLIPEHRRSYAPVKKILQEIKQ